MTYIPSATQILLDNSTAVTQEEVLNRFEKLYTELHVAKNTTSRIYRVKQMEKLYTTFPFLHTIYEYIKDTAHWIDKFVKRIKTCLFPFTGSIIWNEITPMQKGTNQFYLIRCVDTYGNLIYSKIGTTTRETSKRMREHLRYYAKDGVVAIYVDRLYNCNNIDPEGLESEFRAKYIKQYAGAFKKNDRFINVTFNLQQADEIVQKYLES